MARVMRMGKPGSPIPKELGWVKDWLLTGLERKNMSVAWTI